jgi:TonB family protein
VSRASRAASRADLIDTDSSAPPPRRSLIVPALGVVLIIGVVWAGIRLFGTKPPSDAAMDTVSETRPDAPPGAAEEASGSPAPAANARASANLNANAPNRAMASAGNKVSAKSNPATAVSGGSVVAVQEALPEVPQRSRRTIRGHVRVSVRVIVEQDGTVFAALAEHRGPSRYFERLAVDAAKKWTFTPADGDAAQRLMLVKFDFTRNGTTADAIPLK